METKKLYQALENVVEARAIAALQVDEGGVAQLVLEVDPAQGAQIEEMRQAAENALTNLRDYNERAAEKGNEPIEFVVGIDFGRVTLGNIGSPDRLDFTVVGQAVNVASRVQDLCKKLDEKILVTQGVAEHMTASMQSVGYHAIRGLPEAIGAFRVR